MGLGATGGLVKFSKAMRRSAGSTSPCNAAESVRQMLEKPPLEGVYLLHLGSVFSIADHSRKQPLNQWASQETHVDLGV